MSDVQEPMADSSCDTSSTMSDENEKSSSDFDDITTFFKNSTIFLTGVTGFLGHVLLAKLLSSCLDFRRIYILIREKRNRGVHERFQELFDAPIFEKAKLECPDYFHKIAPIKGDCLKPNLDISDADRQILQAEVNVIFHVAATVRFDAPLKDAVYINVRSTKDLLEIAKNMEKLQAFVHVSTAFSFCAGRKVIEEKLYEPPISASSLITVMDQLDHTTIDKITPQLLDVYPNTYVYTKAVTEGIFSSKLNLPIAIFRPAIVISTAKEPLRGWINNTYGPTGIIAAAGIGLMRSLHADKNCNANVVPCDYVINALIASAWYTAKRWQNLEKLGISESEEIPIFNYGSSYTKKALTWQEFMYENEILEPEIPFSSSLWVFSFRLNKYKIIHQLYILFLHLLPAIIIDKIAEVCGKKPRLWDSYQKIHKLANVISYFSTREWLMPNHNVQKLWNMLSEKDKQKFYFNLDQIDWKEYFRDHLLGIRQYIIKDSYDTIPYALQKRRKLRITHYTILSIFLLLFVYGVFIFLQNFISELKF